MKGTLLWSGLALIPLLTALNGREIPFMNSTMLLMIVFFFPCMVCCAYMIGGGLSMLAEIAIGLISMNMAFGTGGLIAGAALTVIPACAYILICEKDVAFHKCIGVMMAVYALVDIALLIWMRILSGGDLLAFAADAVENSFRNMTFMGETGIGDETVQLLAKMGYFGNVSPDVETAYSELRILVEDMTLSLLLSLVSNIILSSVFAVGGARHFAWRSGLRRGEKIDLPKNGMPALRNWFIPRQWGAAIGLFAIGIVIELIFSYEENPSMNITGTVFFSIFETFYMIQGIAVLNAMHHKRGSGRFARVMIPILLMAILPLVAVLLGVWDQAKDIRGLRGPKKDQEEDNDEGNFIA